MLATPVKRPVKRPVNKDRYFLLPMPHNMYNPNITFTPHIHPGEGRGARVESV